MYLWNAHRRQDDKPLLTVGLDPREITRVQREPIPVRSAGYPADIMIACVDDPVLLRKHLSKLPTDRKIVVFAIGNESIRRMKTGLLFTFEPEQIQECFGVSFPWTIVLFYAESRTLGRWRLRTNGILVTG